MLNLKELESELNEVLEFANVIDWGVVPSTPELRGKRFLLRCKLVKLQKLAQEFNEACNEFVECEKDLESL